MIGLILVPSDICKAYHLLVMSFQVRSIFTAHVRNETVGEGERSILRLRSSAVAMRSIGTGRTQYAATPEAVRTVVRQLCVQPYFQETNDYQVPGT